jgi:mRNA interferase HigB
MIVIALKAIKLFGKYYPLAVVPLNEWYKKTKEADWINFNEVKQTFNSCDAIGNDRYVFNIGGNNYRLIAMIHFKNRTLYIRDILTHAQYDEHNKKGTLQNL